MSTPIDRINQLQRRILAGEDPSAEEMAEVIKQLRSERASVSETAEGRRKAKQPAKPVDIASLFAQKVEKP